MKQRQVMIYSECFKRQVVTRAIAFAPKTADSKNTEAPGATITYSGRSFAKLRW